MIIQASLADGLTVPTVGVNAFATGAPIIDKVIQTKIHQVFTGSNILADEKIFVIFLIYIRYFLFKVITTLYL